MRRNSTIDQMSKEIEKIIKRVQGDSDKKINRRFNGFIEIMNNQFKIVTEHFKHVYEKFEKIDGRFDSVDKTLDSHTNSIAVINMDLIEVKRDIKDVKFEVVTKLDNKVDKKHFVDLDQRVRRLEKK